MIKLYSICIVIFILLLSVLSLAIPEDEVVTQTVSVEEIMYYVEFESVATKPCYAYNREELRYIS